MVEDDFSVSIQQKLLRAMIEETAFAVSTNESRPIHTGSLFEVDSEGLSRVLAAEDAEADQSAVLADLPQEILTKLVLPLGDFTKADVEEMLAEAAE